MQARSKASNKTSGSIGAAETSHSRVKFAEIALVAAGSGLIDVSLSHRVHRGNIVRIARGVHPAFA